MLQEFSKQQTIKYFGQTRRTSSICCCYE